MNLSKLTAVALAASLGLASIAGAQPASGPDQEAGHGSRQQTPDRAAPGVARGAGPDHQFRQGQRLPDEWRHRQHVVTDWRAHHLAPPPRGQEWVQVGADFVLVATATGLITSLILSH
ncbi:MAG: RcnB family protein [Xenophilus sp.]